MKPAVVLLLLSVSSPLWIAACRAVPDTPLASAAVAGDAARIRTLLAAGARVDEPDTNGLTPLMWAARRGHLEAVTTLIAAGADVNRYDAHNGWNVLMHAIHTNEPEAVHALLEARADPNARIPAFTPLIMAAGYGYTGMVRDLLQHGADPYAVASDGMTALSAAVGGAPDVDRFTVASCQTSTVRTLLERAPDLKVDLKSFGGRWAMRFAWIGNCKEIVDLVQSRRMARGASGK